MAQISTVLKGDPETLVTQLTTIAASNTIEILEGTFSASQYLLVYDDSAPGGQTVVALKGDPQTVSDAMNLLIPLSTKVILCASYSKASFILVYN